MTLIGFGGFSVQKRKGRTGRDPRTGESIVIASKNFPKFSAGERLKGILNDKTKS
ncbi:MAG: HU family DNA-binding protein [Rheinheimera sp.]